MVQKKKKVIRFAPFSVLEVERYFFISWYGVIPASWVSELSHTSHSFMSYRPAENLIVPRLQLSKPIAAKQDSLFYWYSIESTIYNIIHQKRSWSLKICIVCETDSNLFREILYTQVCPGGAWYVWRWESCKWSRQDKEEATQSHKTESARVSWVNTGCMLSTWRRIPLQAFVFCLGSWRRVQLQSLSHRVEVRAEVLLPPGGQRCTCSRTLDAASSDDPPPAPFVRCLVGEEVVCL